MGAAAMTTASAGGDVTGLMIIRAWVEPGSSDPLRAQVRFATDLSTGIQRVVTLCRPADVIAVLIAWLAEVSGPDDPPPSAVVP